jgi:hypothetical protein
VSRRWIAFLAGIVATLVLAAGFGLAMDRVATAPQPTPHLKTVSTSALARLGVTLSPATQAPYCGIERAAAGRGWLHPGSAGCAIGQDAARDAAARATGGAAEESVLASVTSVRTPALHQHLAWVVVVRGGPMAPPAVACVPIGESLRPCPVRWPAALSDRVVLLDARSAQVLAVIVAGITAPPRVGVLGAGGALPPRGPLWGG